MTSKKTNTGFKGVTKRSNPKASNFEATVNINGTRIFYKGTKTLQDAVRARRQFIIDLL